jgi:hypothetical protein
MTAREEIARAIHGAPWGHKGEPEHATSLCSTCLGAADAVIAALESEAAVTRVARALWLHGSEGLDPDLDPGGTEENMPLASDAIAALLRGTP